jgi:hypothetical protein
MDQKLTVPLEISTPAQRPAKSLHAVRMPRREVEYAPEWQDNAQIKWREVEERAQPETSSPPQYAQPYQQHEVMNYMEDQSSGEFRGNSQHAEQPQLPQPPNALDYDLYDPNSAAEYQRANNDYIQNMVQRQVQTAMQPHQGQLREAELAKEYNGCVADYGADEDFQTIMQVAMQNMVSAGGRGSLREAYERAADQSAARPGKRGYGRLPTALRRTDSLGKIMFHNQQTGRASFEKRNRW